MLIWRPKHEIEKRSTIIRQDFYARYDWDELCEQLCREQGGICAICRHPLQSSCSVVTAVDHAISVFTCSIWGETIEDACERANARHNLLAVHRGCNSVKNSWDYEEFMEKLESGELSLKTPSAFTSEQIEQLKQRRFTCYSVGAKKGWENATPEARLARSAATAARCKKQAQDPNWIAANAAAARKRAQDQNWIAVNAAAVRKTAQTPEWQAKVAAANKKKAQDPQWIAINATAARRRAQDPKCIAAVVAGAKKRAQDLKWRAINAATLEKTKQTSEWKAAHAAGIEKRSQNPEWRAAVVAGATKRSQNPDWRAATIASAKKRAQDPKWLEANAAVLRQTNHLRWHAKRNIKKEGCTLCFPPS
jgi:hypothetical protein